MCSRPTHRALGALAGQGALAVAATAGLAPALSPDVLDPGAWTLALVAAGAGGALTGAGRSSPDMDQYGFWRALDRMVPDEVLGAAGPMRHRGITHWWGIPVALSLFLAVFWPGPELGLAAVVLIAGWVSHLVGDFVVGARYRGNRRGEEDKTLFDADDAPRGPGIPLAPWWGHAGLGYRNGSSAEWALAALAVIGIVALAGFAGALGTLAAVVAIEAGPRLLASKGSRRSKAKARS